VKIGIRARKSNTLLNSSAGRRYEIMIGRAVKINGTVFFFLKTFISGIYILVYSRYIELFISKIIKCFLILYAVIISFSLSLRLEWFKVMSSGYDIGTSDRLIIINYFLSNSSTNDGFVEWAITLPNGTLQIGEEYTACSIIFKVAHLTCDKGFNAPTNRAEYVDVLITIVR
jgi:hypothetical protein